MALLDRLSRQARFGVELAGAAWPQLLRPLALELASHRPICEVLPGVHHWTAIHPRIRLPVDSYYIESARIVLDPMVPREGLEWFEQRATPSQIVLTNRHHLRHSERFAEAFDCPIRCSDAGLHEFERGPKVEGFAFGAELAPGITAHQLGAICPDDTAIQIRTAGDGALVFADGLTRPRGGGLGFVPGFLMGDDPAAVRDGLRESLRRLLDLDFDSLLFAHGEPLIGGGKVALRKFVAVDDPPARVEGDAMIPAGMDSTQSTRVLIVANRTAATPRLLEEVRARARRSPCTFTLLVPRPYWDPDTEESAVTLELAIPLLSEAAAEKVDGIVGDTDPFVAVQQALEHGDFDELIISTLPAHVSRWLHRDLPHRVESFGLPVTVVTAQ